MRKMIAASLAVALLCLARCAPAYAEIGPGKVDKCATPATVRADVAKFPFRASVTQMTTDQSAVFLSAFNALPPRSSLTADFVIAVTAPDKPGVIIALFEGGCVSKTIFMPRSVFLKAMGVET